MGDLTVRSVTVKIDTATGMDRQFDSTSARMLDVAISLLAIVFLAPLMILIGLAIAASGDPVRAGPARTGARSGRQGRRVAS